MKAWLEVALAALIWFLIFATIVLIAMGVVVLAVISGFCAWVCTKQLDLMEK